ncbi:enoyl-CoA hydratase/isomerase family protein [Novosphingobium colocasiae]|uniref:Enoyl-CoA hydratase n=1 Tax=Novosphingobium colocasiae TaxID=1256513 RepID=A0A918PNR5_9SPHN|nr:enoyl-CoA hydratase/isomerase family protein [Novosphingobium colocasiae]GGZ17521.1 enoyl-CoA hydratase [Novosphingobium colocasiae]
MADDQLVLEDNGAVFTLTINRADKLNALSPALVRDLLVMVRKVAASDARVLVLTGAGRAFSAGVDLKSVSSPEYTAESSRAFAADARAVIDLLETMPQATIAKVNGYCFTGGLEIALGCDFIMASDNSVFCDTHAKIGMRPKWGLSQRLPRRIGLQRAKEMSFTARRISAAEAVEIGLILRAVPAEQLDAEVASLAASIVANSADSVTAYKDLYGQVERVGLDEGLCYEATVTLELHDHATAKASSLLER